jgi:predicted alpha/beta-fold hydrolase
MVMSRRERVEIPDGDFWDFDWTDPPHAAPETPLVVLLHGLEGGSGSHYARALMAFLASCGWRGVVAHFRGCSGERNRMPRAYHSGDYEELALMLAAVRSRTAPATPLYAVGVSVGGSVLLNWLGRARGDAGKILKAAAAVSTPLDLLGAGIAIDKGFNRIYVRHFLSTLKPKSLEMARRFPGLLDEPSIRRAHSLYAFDDAVTSRLHGFTGAHDYWTRASAKPWLAKIALPTLVLNAKNDPFVPRDSLPNQRDVSSDVLLVQPDDGGHGGFLDGPFPGNLLWLPRRLLDFFAHHR